MRAVDFVAEDPAATAEALAVSTFPAEPARSAGGDARDEYFVAGLEVLDAATDFVDRADSLVAEDASIGDGGDVA